MQRSQRSNAGNIYKKRLEEIQMEAPRAKNKGKVKTKSKSKSPPKTAKKATKSPANKSRYSSSGNRDSESVSEEDHWDSESQAVSEEAYSTHSDETATSTKTTPNSKTSPADSSHASSPATRASLRIKQNLNRFKCPHCKATFAELRYVEFHLQQMHKSALEEEEEDEDEDLPFVQKKKSPSTSPAAKNKQDTPVVHSKLKNTASDIEDEDNNDADMDMMEFESEDPTAKAKPEDVDDYYEIEQNDGSGTSYYVCRRCPDYKTQTKQIIVSHVQSHISNNYVCPYCHSKFKNRASLETHLYNHTGVKPFCCKLCDLTFKSSDDMLKHCRTGHSQKEIRQGTVAPAASVSGRPSPTNARKRGGQGESKSPDSPFTCPYCFERFMSVVNLKTHLNIHKIKGEADEETDKTLWAEIAKQSVNEIDVGGSQRFSDFDFEPSRGKKAKKEVLIQHAEPEMKLFGENPMSTFVLSEEHEAPPQCKICNRVFLYTTQIERHMQTEHGSAISPSSPSLMPPRRLATSPFRSSAGSGLSNQNSPSSPSRDLTPVITSVVSQAAVPDSSSAESNKPVTVKSPVVGNRVRAMTTNGKGSSTAVPGSSTIAHVAKSIKPAAGGVPGQPLYFLVHSADNTCIPVEASTVDAVTSANSAESSDQESRIDVELELELKRLGKPGTPLLEGADNQNLEHECSVCQQKIVGYTEIVKHLHTHTESEAVCHLCQKSFSAKASLGIHFLTHVGITFSCPICHKQLSKKQSLLEHIRGHQGARRFPCKQCGKKFITSSSLNRHLRTHVSSAVATETAGNLFQCGQCPTIFQNIDALIHHQRAHDIIAKYKKEQHVVRPETTVPIQCKYCGKLWASVSGLTKHLKSAHGPNLGQGPTIKREGDVDLTQQVEETDVIVTEAEASSNMKIIDIIDLSDDEDGNQLRTVGVDNTDVELPLTVVNVDGQDVDAIEIVTTDILANTNAASDRPDGDTAAPDPGDAAAHIGNANTADGGNAADGGEVADVGDAADVGNAATTDVGDAAPADVYTAAPAEKADTVPPESRNETETVADDESSGMTEPAETPKDQTE